MKFFVVIVTFIAFCKVNSGLRVPEVKSLQKAFVNILETLARRNHVVSLVSVGGPEDQGDSTSLISFADTPHVVARLDNESKRFRLNSSAIVLLDSVTSLATFNKHALLPSTFSMSQQLFVYCHDGTFDKISKLNTLRDEVFPI